MTSRQGWGKSVTFFYSVRLLAKGLDSKGSKYKHTCVQSDLGGVAVLLLLEAVEVEVFRLFRFFSLKFNNNFFYVIKKLQ